MNALRNPTLTALAWVLVRLYVGYAWLSGGIEKVFRAGSAGWVGSKAATAVTGFLNGALATSALAVGFDPATTPFLPVQTWYAVLIRDVFLPNAALFSYLIAVGELLVGVALLLGLFTRFAAT